MEQQFKVGSVYRQRNGQIVRLHPAAWGLPASDVVVHAKRLDGLGEGHRYPTTGKEWDETMVAHNRDLIPGELTLVDGEWVGFDFKREDEPAGSRPPYGHKPTTLGDLLRGAKAILDKLPAATPPATEKPRPALDWATVKRFDPFPGYRVTSDTGPMVDAADHPLQRLQLADPACGSAHIKDVPAGHLLGQGVKS